MPSNVITYTTVTSFSGALVNGDGCDTSRGLPDIAALIATDDSADNHVLQVTRVEFGDDGRSTCTDVTSECAEMVAALYDSEDVPTSEDHFVSPIVEQWTDWAASYPDYDYVDLRREHGLQLSQVL